MQIKTATETDNLTILDALAHYLHGRALQARKDGDDGFTLSTTDVQTRVMSRCRERYGVVALPTTFARKWRKLRNNSERLRNVGIGGTETVSHSPLTIRFTLTDE